MKQVSGQIGLSGFPAKPDNRPPIGTIMYTVYQHCYYVENPWPEIEYLVCQARVKDYYEYGNIPEFELLLCVPNVHSSCYTWSVPELRRVSDIGKRVYYTPKEAAEEARDLTDKHERTWGWCKTERPLRRTWERLLDGAGFYLAPLISRRYPAGGGDYET